MPNPFMQPIGSMGQPQFGLLGSPVGGQAPQGAGSFGVPGGYMAMQMGPQAMGEEPNGTPPGSQQQQQQQQQQAPQMQQRFRPQVNQLPIGQVAGPQRPQLPSPMEAMTKALQMGGGLGMGGGFSPQARHGGGMTPWAQQMSQLAPGGASGGGDMMGLQGGYGAMQGGQGYLPGPGDKLGY